jgi:chemosensory pili system protein ChpA (sensor histidine kinase/response regulator)
VANDPTPAFDVGPLSWVQGEIDQALARGLETIAAFKANPTDPTALKHARAHVHQAAGAIQMVGLDAVVAFTDELERQLTRMEELPAAEAQAACVVVDRACRKLRIFLDELVNGAAPVPLKLYPEYEAMQVSRGVKAAAPTDLFYPELSPRAPRISARESIAPNRLPSHMVKQRRLYQRGMLAWLRGEDTGAAMMRDAVAGIEDITAQGSLRAFWWTVGALLEGVVESGLDRGFGVAAVRGYLQIRRRGRQRQIADRFAAQCCIRSDLRARGAAVQASSAFRLSASFLPPVLPRVVPAAAAQEAREQLAGAGPAEGRLRARREPAVNQTLASVRTKAAEIHNGADEAHHRMVERIDRCPSGV